MLTPREKQITNLVRQCKSTKAIARELGCSIRTVEWHIAEAASKVPGPGRPREKLIWFFGPGEEDSDAA